MTNKTNVNLRSFKSEIVRFIDSCRINAHGYDYSSTVGGSPTLYASVFACMLLHYLGELEKLPQTEKFAWADYLNSWQEPVTGYFIGPELKQEEMRSKKHSF